MFKKIEELHDHKTNEGFYPLTHVQAVIDNDEIDLKTKLNQINNALTAASKLLDNLKRSSVICFNNLSAIQFCHYHPFFQKSYSTIVSFYH